MTPAASPSPSAAYPCSGYPVPATAVPLTPEQLVTRSDLIVVGRVDQVGPVLNVARLSSDRTKAALNMFGVGQVYRMIVDHALKGVPGQRLDVVRFEGYLVGATHPSEAAVAEARACEGRGRPRVQDNGPLPLATGAPLLLYLRGPVDYYVEHQGPVYSINKLVAHPTAESLQRIERYLATSLTPMPTLATPSP